MKTLALKALAFGVLGGLAGAAMALGWLVGVYVALGPLAR